MKEVCLVTIDGVTRQAKSAIEFGHPTAEWYVDAESYQRLFIKQNGMEKILKAARSLKALMTEHATDFRIEAKDLAATMTAGQMIEDFRTGLSEVDGND